jgi:hypothetical protein
MIPMNELMQANTAKVHQFFDSLAVRHQVQTQATASSSPSLFPDGSLTVSMNVLSGRNRT